MEQTEFENRPPLPPLTPPVCIYAQHPLKKFLFNVPKITQSIFRKNGLVPCFSPPISWKYYNVFMSYWFGFKTLYQFKLISTISFKFMSNTIFDLVVFVEVLGNYYFPLVMWRHWANHIFSHRRVVAYNHFRPIKDWLFKRRKWKSTRVQILLRRRWQIEQPNLQIRWRIRA